MLKSHVKERTVSMADCTPEQKQIVEEILKVTATDYYKVLKVDKTSNEVEIKKSYRKLAIKLHPDKNKHPKASEAFKVIAKAFEVLSDPGKKKLYDMTGRDPDSRGGGGGAGAGGGFPANGFRQNGPFHFTNRAEGFPADDIFNMFFGGGQPAFGNGGGFQRFQFGGNGFPGNGFYFNQGMNGDFRGRQQFHNAGNNARRRATGEQEPQTPRWMNHIAQYLPIILILFSLLTSMFGSDQSSSKGPAKTFSGRVPRYGFENQVPLTVERKTPMYGVSYFISPKTEEEFSKRKDSDGQLRGLDKYVENKYVESLENGCYIEKRKQEAMFNDAQGLFFNDWELIERARNLDMPNCAKLQALKLI